MKVKIAQNDIEAAKAAFDEKFTLNGDEFFSDTSDGIEAQIILEDLEIPYFLFDGADSYIFMPEKGCFSDEEREYPEVRQLFLEYCNAQTL